MSKFVVKEIEFGINELKCKLEERHCKTVIDSRYDHLSGYIACALHANIISNEDYRNYNRLAFDLVYGEGAHERISEDLN